MQPLYPIFDLCAKLHHQDNVWLHHQLQQMAHGCFPFGVYNRENDPSHFVFNRMAVVTEKTRQKLQAEAKKDLYQNPHIKEWNRKQNTKEELLIVQGDLSVEWSIREGRSADIAEDRHDTDWIQFQDSILCALLEWIQFSIPHEEAWKTLLGNVQRSHTSMSSKCYSQRYMFTATALHKFGEELDPRADMPLGKLSRLCKQRYVALNMTKDKGEILL